MRILDSKHLVFVPGLLSTEELWREVRQELKEDLDCRVTQQNLRQSSCEEMADAILAESPPNFSIVGNGLGAYVSTLVALKAPERIFKLCLMGGVFSPASMEKISILEDILDSLDTKDFNDTKSKAQKFLLSEDGIRSDTIKARFNSMADIVGGDRFRVQLKALLESQSLEEKLSKIQCDTLVIAAESDCLVSPQESQLLIQLIYSSTLVLVKDAAHLATLDRPKTISELLRQWLTGVLEIDKGQVTI